jgi:hypothetical protein
VIVDVYLLPVGMTINMIFFSAALGTESRWTHIVTPAARPSIRVSATQLAIAAVSRARKIF